MISQISDTQRKRQWSKQVWKRAIIENKGYGLTKHVLGCIQPSTCFRLIKGLVDYKIDGLKFGNGSVIIYIVSYGMQLLIRGSLINRRWRGVVK